VAWDEGERIRDMPIQIKSLAPQPQNDILLRYRAYGVGSAMAFLSGILGHAGELDLSQAKAEYGRLLGSDENIEISYKIIRDVILLTDQRILFIDKQGITGRKIEYLSIPYRSVVRFSVESVGHWDLDAELKIWVSGSAEPIQRTFNHKVDVYALQAALAKRILR
jgi:hypothetical protein